MAAIRLQVMLNGRPLCIAGLDEHGTLSATVTVDRLPKQPDPFLQPQDPADEEHCELRVEAQTLAADDSLRWLVETVKPGDEVTIRVLGPGPHDDPAERIANEVF